MTNSHFTLAVLSPKWWDMMRHTAREANRLIGDEQLPADVEFSVQGVGGRVLKSWPKWLLDRNTPRTSGRRTFATYKHWNGSEPLLTSGLLGPAAIHATERIAAP